jgi:hypothetical protein
MPQRSKQPWRSSRQRRPHRQSVRRRVSGHARVPICDVFTKQGAAEHADMVTRNIGSETFGSYK